jgi:hypothetical protein
MVLTEPRLFVAEVLDGLDQRDVAFERERGIVADHVIRGDEDTEAHALNLRLRSRSHKAADQLCSSSPAARLASVLARSMS